jgi:hypothetical protein
MLIVLTLLLLASPDAKGAAPKSEVPKVADLLTKDKPGKAIKLLRIIGTHKDNHAEAVDLVKLIRASKPKKAPEVYEACFRALKGIGSRKVTSSLIALFKHPRLKKEPMIRAGICTALGGSADPKAVSALTDRMRDPDDRVIAAAVDAAGPFRYAKVSVRKELFKAVIAVYVPTWNMKESVNPDHKKRRQRAERRWELIAKPCERSLQLLSDTTQADPPAWRRWWNDHKKKKWAELGD